MFWDEWREKPTGSCRIRLESDGYRADRDAEIRALALEAAEEARRSRKVVRLPPLNPYERRIVHMAVSELSGIVTESHGDGFTKRIDVKVEGTEPGGQSGRYR